MGMEIQKSVFDGEKGYMIVQGQRIENDEPTNRSHQESTTTFIELNPKNAQLTGMENVGGNQAYAVSYGPDKVCYYDAATGLKIKEINTIKQAGMEVQSESYYSDYKVVNGINIPHKRTDFIGPQEIEFNLSQVLINEGVSDEDFK